MPIVKSFKDLEIWQLATELDKKIMALIEIESVSKDLAFKDQINRLVGSVANRIAEGFRRGSWLEFIQHLSMARTAVSGIQSQLILGLKKDLFPKEIFDDLFELTEKTGNKIDALIKYLNHS